MQKVESLLFCKFNVSFPKICDIIQIMKVTKGATTVANFTIQGLRMKSEYMMEKIRQSAVLETFEQFKKADEHYYRTSEGGAEVTRLIKELENLGANMEIVTDTDLEIRDKIFAE